MLHRQQLRDADGFHGWVLGEGPLVLCGCATGLAQVGKEFAKRLVYKLGRLDDADALLCHVGIDEKAANQCLLVAYPV